MAKSRSIGSIYAELTLKDKMSKGIASARKSLNSFGASMLKMTGPAVAAGIGTIGVAMAKAIQQGGDLADMMARTGAAGEGLVVMQRAFENAGLAASTVPDALQRMQKALAGTDGAAFEAIGLSASKLINMDAGQAFAQIATSIAAIENPAQRTAAAMAIFGKSGGKLLAIFNDKEAFNLATQQVGQLGKTLGENASQLDAVGDAFGALETKMVQLGATVAVAVLPHLTKLGDNLNEMDLTEAGQKIGTLTDKAIKLAESLARVAELTPAFQLGKLAENLIYDGGQLTEEDKKKAQEMAQSWAASDKNFMKSQLGAPEMMGPPSSLAPPPEMMGPPIAAMMPEVIQEIIDEVRAFQPDESWRSSPAENMVSDYQRRGLSMHTNTAEIDRTNLAKESNTILKAIHGELRNSSRRKPTW